MGFENILEIVFFFGFQFGTQSELIVKAGCRLKKRVSLFYLSGQVIYITVKFRMCLGQIYSLSLKFLEETMINLIFILCLNL
jgi:hypothetical protein